MERAAWVEKRCKRRLTFVIVSNLLSRIIDSLQRLQ